MKKRLLALVLCLVMLIPTQVPSYAAGPTNQSFVNVAGDNRYATGVEAAKTAFKNETPSEIVIVYGGDFPDALTANAYAGALNAPILLSRRTGLPDEVKNLLSKTWNGHIKKVTVIGGLFEPQFFADLKEYCGADVTVENIYGNNRYETADKVLEAGIQKGLFTGDQIIVATGTKAADATSISPWSYGQYIPLVLADKTSRLRDSTVALINKYTNFKNVILLGGVDNSCTCGLESIRLMGNDRYETSQQIAEYFVERGGSYNNLAFAAGSDRNFPDALVAGMLQGKMKAPVVLSSPKKESVQNFVREKLAGHDYTLYFLGATAEGNSGDREMIADVLTESTQTPAPTPTPTPIEPEQTPAPDIDSNSTPSQKPKETIVEERELRSYIKEIQLTPENCNEYFELVKEKEFTTGKNSITYFYFYPKTKFFLLYPVKMELSIDIYNCEIPSVGANYNLEENRYDPYEERRRQVHSYERTIDATYNSSRLDSLDEIISEDGKTALRMGAEVLGVDPISVQGNIYVNNIPDKAWNIDANGNRYLAIRLKQGIGRIWKDHWKHIDNDGNLITSRVKTSNYYGGEEYEFYRALIDYIDYYEIVFK